jgi:hypothetical protein
MADERLEAGAVAAQARMMSTKALNTSRAQPVSVNPLTGAAVPRSMSRGATTMKQGLRYRKMEDPHEQALLEATFFTVESVDKEQAEVSEITRANVSLLGLMTNTMLQGGCTS